MSETKDTLYNKINYIGKGQYTIYFIGGSNDHNAIFHSNSVYFPVNGGMLTLKTATYLSENTQKPLTTPTIGLHGDFIRIQYASGANVSGKSIIATLIVT